MSKVKMPALPVLPYADIIDRASIRAKMVEVQLAAAEAMREACAAKIDAIAASCREDGDDSEEEFVWAAAAIRALEVEQS